MRTYKDGERRAVEDAGPHGIAADHVGLVLAPAASPVVMTQKRSQTHRKYAITLMSLWVTSVGRLIRIHERAARRIQGHYQKPP